MNAHQSLKNAIRPFVYYIPDRIRRWQRRRQLKSTRTAVSKERLVEDLSRLPVDRHAIVLVHSSLKALGYVESGAATVVEALVDAFVERNGGTVMVPTYSIASTMHDTLVSGEVFDVAATPSNLGAIPEALRRRPDAVRSIHPTHSFAAIGRDSRWLVEEHHTCGTSFGAKSPMAKMLKKNGYILGLGTNLGNVTFYHCLEEMEPDFPFDVFTADSPISVECKGYSGDVHQLEIKAHDPTVSRTRIDRPENEGIRTFFTRYFEQRAGMRWVEVGEARCWFMQAAHMYDELFFNDTATTEIYTTTSDLVSLDRREMPQASVIPKQGEE
jgi:aminoglycoside N3'-acetyltransferase